MAVGFTSDAQDAILNGARVMSLIYIDVEQNGTGSYGVNVIDITTYQSGELPKLKRSSSIISKKWKTEPIVLRVNNATGYFTPNMCGVSKDQVTNVWQSRPSGEADYKECKLYIDQEVLLPDKTTETLRRFSGMIVHLNFIIDGHYSLCEIVVRDNFLNALDQTFEIGDGGSDTAVAP